MDTPLNPTILLCVDFRTRARARVCVCLYLHIWLRNILVSDYFHGTDIWESSARTSDDTFINANRQLPPDTYSYSWTLDSHPRKCVSSSAAQRI